MKVADLYATLAIRPDGASFKRGNDLLSGIGKAVIAFAGYKAIGALGGMVTATIAVADAAVNTAKKLGITTEAVQQLDFAARQSGTTGEAVFTSMRKLSAGLEEVRRTGKGAAADGLRAIGLSAKALKGETLDQNLEAIAEAVSKMPDGAKKIAAVQNLLGRGGAQLIPLLNEGAGGIAKLRNEAEELGIVIDGQTAKGLDDLGDDVDKVKGSLLGLRNQAIKALLPTIKEMVVSLTKWIKANREMLVEKLTTVMSGLATVLRGLAKGVAFVVEHWQIFAALLAGTAFVAGITRIIKLVQWLQMASTAAAAKMVIAWAVAALPFLAIAALVALVVLALTKYRKQTEQVVNWIKQKFNGLMSWIKSLPGRAVGALSDMAQAIKDAFGAALDWVVDKADRTWKKIRNAPVIKQVLDVVGAPIREKSLRDTVSGSAAYKSRFGVGAGDTALTPVGPRGSTSNTFGDIVVNSTAADPVAVGQEVRKVVREEWSNEMRGAYAGTGAP